MTTPIEPEETTEIPDTAEVVEDTPENDNTESEGETAGQPVE